MQYRGLRETWQRDETFTKTTRRYSLPTAEDREMAMEMLKIEY